MFQHSLFLQMIRRLATVFLVTVLAKTACAVVVYNESIDGDLPADPALAPTIPLAPGENIILGGLVEQATPNDFEDSLNFETPDRHVIKAEKWRFSSSDLTDSITVRFKNYLPFASVWDAEWTFMGGDLFPAELGTKMPDGGGSPIGAIQSGIHGMQLKAGIDPQWELIFFVEAIPEPSSLVLAITGIVVIAFRKI